MKILQKTNKHKIHFTYFLKGNLHVFMRSSHIERAQASGPSKNKHILPKKSPSFKHQNKTRQVRNPHHTPKESSDHPALHPHPAAKAVMVVKYSHH